MIYFPNAKINIGLYITEKRNDGFHNIESIFYPIPLCDVLEIIINDEKDTVFSSTGIDIPGSKEENLCVKAYELLRNDFKLPGLKIHLHKIIPIGAGLGGGSADTSFFINAVNELFGLNISASKIEKYALHLGSDCPFFIKNEPAFVTGRGEVFEKLELDLKGYYLVIINPGIHISTKEAYDGITVEKPKISVKDFISNNTISDWKGNIHNQFEDTIFSIYPKIGQIKNTLYDLGATYAAMSGSGSTVFGLFKTKPDFDFKSAYPEYFTWEKVI